MLSTLTNRNVKFSFTVTRSLFGKSHRLPPTSILIYVLERSIHSISHLRLQHNFSFTFMSSNVMFEDSHAGEPSTWKQNREIHPNFQHGTHDPSRT
jgi:hypothetical protein